MGDYTDEEAIGYSIDDGDGEARASAEKALLDASGLGRAVRLGWCPDPNCEPRFCPLNHTGEQNEQAEKRAADELADLGVDPRDLVKS